MRKSGLYPGIRDITAELREHFRELSKSQKKIARFIIQNYEKVPDMSAIQVARSVDVSEATVVRFAISLGFDGYPEFRKYLKNEIHTKLTTIDRINLTMREEEPNLAKKVMRSDMKAIKETIETFDEEVFEECVERIVQARRVIVIGFRTTSLLTEYIGYYFDLLLEDVRIINHSVSDFYEHLIKIRPDDVVLAISFPRYAQKTKAAVEFLKQRNPTIIVISDNDNAPINQYADYVLSARCNAYSFVDSLVAPLSIINALVVAIGVKNIQTTKQTFNELEAIWKANDVYTSEEVERNFLWSE